MLWWSLSQEWEFGRERNSLILKRTAGPDLHILDEEFGNKLAQVHTFAVWMPTFGFVSKFRQDEKFTMFT